jgi:hypothetical protein
LESGLERLEVNAIFGRIRGILARRDAYFTADFQQRFGQVPYVMQPMALDVAFND